MSLTTLLLCAGSLLAADPRPDGLWLEGEAPSRTSFPFQSGGWGRAEYLSGQKWLFVAVEADQVASKVPASGAGATYEFKVAAPGQYDVWARIGYEFARSPFRWRIGEGEWRTVGPDELTTDLMAIADFAEVAWLKLGQVELIPGPHTLEFDIPRPTKGRLLFGLDCVCLSRRPFTPNGPHQPGSDWRTPLDRAAEQTRFEFPAAPTAEPDARRVVNLAGSWQIARFDENEIHDRTGPIPALPPDLDALPWKGIRVPGDKDTERPDLAYCHRYLYRTRVNVPADLVGRSFLLRFPNNALLTTVFVNGKPCGFSRAPCASFECDVTAAMKPGVNEIVVGIKDLYYAIARTGDGKSCRYLFNYPTEKFHTAAGLGPTRYADFPVLFKVRRNGILETPSLIAAGPVYTADVFAQPSVARKQLGLEITLHNPGANSVAVEIRNAVRAVTPEGRPTGPPTKVFASQTRSLAPGKSEVLRLNEPWPDPRLWWPDDPHRYAVETTLLVGGRAVDEVVTLFGFREWGISGRTFTLNGVPWHLRADQRHAAPQSGPAAEAAVQEWRRNGQNMVRFWGDVPWTGASQRETLDFFDRAGMPVRRSGIFDGEVASYQLVLDGKPNTALFENWRHQLAAWVKAERNHPSVFIWSLENEITYINARNFGWLPQVEPEIKKAAELVRSLDPTRPVMIDGGDALLDQSLPVAGNHYLEGPMRDYPDEAYTLERAYTRHTGPRPKDPWPIPKDKPLFLGESFFANGSPPAAYAEIAGEGAFLGRREAAVGVTRFARMLSEGYRWHGVAAFHFWFDEGPHAEHYQAWQPVAVLVREWDSSFAAGSKVTRTLKLFNDTHQAGPITVHWLFQTRNANPVTQLRGKKTLTLAPGRSEVFPIELEMPKAPPGARIEADLILSCERDGRQVFLDTKRCRVLGPPVAAGGKGGEVVLWDPAGKGAPLLEGLTAYTSINSLDEVPSEAKVLVVGPDAVTAALATDPKWTALAARGLRVLVLDQKYPLHYQAVPTDLEPTDFTGRIAFPENLQHRAFAGLGPEDFFCWSGDHVVYRQAYRKPTRGGRSLLQCGPELSSTGLVEVPVRDGLLLLCQLAVGQKPNDPVARRVTANLLRHARNYQRLARPTVVHLPDNDPRLRLLTESGLRFQRAESAVDALGQGEVVVVDANPRTLAQLATAAGRVKEFTDAGGWLVLWGLTPEGLTDFNTLVGFDHALRPFRRERVTFAPRRDPLTAGLSLRDVALESPEKIYPWAGDRYPADDTFTHVVDLADIAPFVRADRFADGWAKMTNGLTSADSWKFIFYHDQEKDGERPIWSGRLPKTEEITGLSIIINAHYRKLTRLRVVFDNSQALTLTLKPEGELRQDFTFPPRRCRTITLEPLEWTEGSRPVIGIDNLWLTVRRPNDFSARVVPLLNIGALVKYPRGPGGLLLNQVAVAESEANPENAGKKRNLVATLLRNLGAEFAGERLVIPGQNLAYTPIPLGEKANTYLTADKGWPGGSPDLSHFPVGDQRFAGVRYEVRDFRTSPLPVALALTPGKTASVTGIPVGRTADALFFLHTFHRSREPKAGESPVVLRYTIRYGDGESVVVPVRLGRGVAHWQSEAPKALPEAAVAWSAAFPTGRGPAGKHAVVYQMQWTNPYPTYPITAVDVSLDPESTQYGVPVVLGITAASERK